MCILCAVQKWSRRVATMLPWLVIPLVGLWALSQLLPPGLRFEVTSPRVACVLVLLATLFWYEILVPHLSLWRTRRSARLRERRLSQAIELQKLRKSATRSCRNCKVPYRDQNPGGGGRFMCANCGHVSKRPVLDIPATPDGGSGIISDLVGKNGWICGQDWSPFGNGNWVGHDDRCSTERSFSGVVVSCCKLLFCFFLNVRWLWRKLVRVGSPGEDGSSGEDGKGSSSEKGENGENSLESKAEKARRKAEEKRQARLEKEMLEEEERKQREEVARLIEERRKLRDEKSEAEKESLRRSASVGNKETRKGTEKQRRPDGRKERDKGSSKSNSDVEDLEKKASRECEGKHAFDKKSENERLLPQKISAENYRSPVYDRTKGFTQSSSRVFTGSALFGRSYQTSAASVTKFSKPANGFVGRGQSFGNRKDAQSSGHVVDKIASKDDDRKTATNVHRPMESDVQPGLIVQKKSWLQLFTRSSAVSPFPDETTTNCQLEPQSVRFTDKKVLPNYSFDNNLNLGQSLPFSLYPSQSSSLGSSPVSCLADEYISSLMIHSRKDSISDEADTFEDPSFVPDSISLLGPVSASLDNYPLDLGTGSLANSKSSADVSKPSPIEPPLSRLRVSEERHFVPGQLSRDLHGSNLDQSSNTGEEGTWQMWGSPLAQDGWGLVGGPNWVLHLAQNKSKPEDDMISHAAQNVRIGNYQNGGIFNPLGPVPNDDDLWPQRTSFQPLTSDGARNELTCDTPKSSASCNISELPPADCWSKRDCASPGPEEAGNSPIAETRIGGSLFPADPDVQELWSFR